MGKISFTKSKMKLNFKEDKPTVYKIQQVNYAVVDTQTLIDDVAESCGLNKAMTKAALEGIVLLQHVYRSNFKDVAWYVRYVSDNIEFEDAKDIAANTFYELCKIPYPYNPQNFVGLWKDQSRKRALDFLAFRNRYTDSLFFESGEERFGSTDKHIDVADVWSHIHGEKRTKTMKMFAEGMTPTEIAEDLHCTLGTVSSCITRTIQHLQKVYRNDIAV